MKLKYEYEKIDEIPEPVRALYTEQGGKHVLTGVEGVKPLAEVERALAAKRAEVDEHKKTKDRLAAWGDLKPEEVLATLDRVKELETVAGGKLDEKAINDLVETRIGTRLGPIERAKAQLERSLQEKDAQLAGLLTERKQNRIRTAVTQAAIADKVLDTALDDVVLLATTVLDVDDAGKVTVKDSGLDVADWLSDQKAKRPHWWPASRGGGSGGSGVTEHGAGNPFSAEGWNLTKQGEILRTKGEAYANTLAEAAGTKVGGPRPAPKK